MSERQQAEAKTFYATQQRRNRRRLSDRLREKPHAWILRFTRGLSVADYCRAFRAAGASRERYPDEDLAWRLKRYPGNLAQSQAFLDGNTHGDEYPQQFLLDQIEEYRKGFGK